jgi:hypothetical protein
MTTFIELTETEAAKYFPGLSPFTADSSYRLLGAWRDHLHAEGDSQPPARISASLGQRLRVTLTRRWQPRFKTGTPIWVARFRLGSLRS